MGWEERNGSYYYYKKTKVDGKVLSEYIGRGEFAEIISQIDAYETSQTALAWNMMLKNV